MKNFSVPVCGRLCRNYLPELVSGMGLIIGISWLYYDSFAAIPFLMPLLAVWHKEWKKEREKKEREQFLRMFREWILLLSSSLTAGYSVENALARSGSELALMFPHGGIMLEELKEMIRKAGNNQRPEQLLIELAEKYPFDEVNSFVEVFCTARGSGGSLNGIIRKTAAQIAEIMDTRREIETFLAAKIYEQRIMMLMPAGVLFYIRMGSGTFVQDLYHNVPGICVMTVCLAVYLGACVLGRRMVQFQI